jgi:hypothetical protein
VSVEAFSTLVIRPVGLPALRLATLTFEGVPHNPKR